MEIIGKYRIQERIGGGGFGEVFKAYDPLIKRHVAIKTCASDDRNVADRFYQEAEIGGNLHHRNITTVYDFGVHKGLPYLVQEYLSGEDLDVKIKRRDYLPYTEKLLYLLQIARGLAYAHAQGFIHRDVKPANVRILEDGTAKIIDFGIAKLAQQETGLTQTGMTLGTAAYLSPEQVRGDAVDARTDIFSFGILAYELLAYERPFLGDQISTVIYNLLNHEPEPITLHWPGAPPDVVALVDRCLRKDASQRFADGTDLVKALEKLKKRGRSGQRREAVETRPVIASAPPPAAETGPTPGPAGTLREASRHGASGLEYDLAPDPVAPPGAATGELPAENAGRSAPSTAVSLAILLALAVAAAAGGWWLGMRGKPAGSPEGTQTPDEVVDVQPAATGETEQVPAADSAPGSAATETATGEPAAGAEPPVPRPAPATGKLILPRVPWADRMTVRLGENSYGLHRQHEVELPPGTYRAVFAHAGGGYNPASRAVEVRVVAGESVRVAVPIPRPGAVSVRALPGRPQGRVSIDGEPLGPTPLSGILRAPGVYSLEILPLDGDGEGEGEGEAEDQGLVEEITLEAGRETILSFDLDTGSVRTTAKAIDP